MIDISRNKASEDLVGTLQKKAVNLLTSIYSNRSRLFQGAFIFSTIHTKNTADFAEGKPCLFFVLLKVSANREHETVDCIILVEQAE